jgi:hypothetical protein
MTLIEFLLARITDDEALAANASSYYWGRRTLSERVLAECEAKRRIIEAAPWANNGGHSAMKDLPGRWILRLLAAVYADHPDYRDEWRP